jgi:hypothetical protein
MWRCLGLHESWTMWRNYMQSVRPYKFANKIITGRMHYESMRHYGGCVQQKNRQREGNWLLVEEESLQKVEHWGAEVDLSWSEETSWKWEKNGRGIKLEGEETWALSDGCFSSSVYVITKQWNTRNHYLMPNHGMFQGLIMLFAHATCWMKNPFWA